MRKLLIVTSFMLLTLLLVSASDSFADGEHNDARRKSVVIVGCCGDTESGGSCAPVTAGENQHIGNDTGGLVFVGSGDEKKCIKIKKGAYLGIYMEDLTRKKIKNYNYPLKRGVLISDVVDDGPAEEAGIEAGDIIRTFDGRKVEDPDELSEMVLEKDPGDEVKIELYRDGEKITLDVELGERSTDSVHVLKFNEFKDLNHKLGRIHGRLGKTGNFFIR